MKKICLIILIILLFYIGFYIYKIFNYGELGYKPFYLALQGFSSQKKSEFQNLNTTPLYVFVEKGIIYKHKPYDLLGIPTEDDNNPYFWIVTNVENKDIDEPDHIFSIPSGQKFYLLCDDLNALERKEKIVNSVKIFLRKECIKD